MSAASKKLTSGCARLIEGLRSIAARLPARLRAGKAGPTTPAGEEPGEIPPVPRTPDGPPIAPAELPSIFRRLSRDSRIVLTVAVLGVVLITVLIIAIPASIDRIALQRRLAARDADVAAYRSRITALNTRDADRGRFVRRFTAQFMHPQIYKAAAARTAAFKPDGLEDEGALIRSMLWQLKSHRGTAHFLASRKSVRMTVSVKGELPKVEWRETASPLPALLVKLDITPTDRAVRALNIQINRYGFTAINDQAVIARDVDGALVILKAR
ncbi:MAG: hypothetical protein RLT05_19695 [Bauldia litoralis]